MSKNKLLIKYEVINTKKNKNLIGEVFDFKKVKVKGGSGSDGGRKPDSTNKITLTKLSNKVDTLANNLNTLTNNLDVVTNRLDVVTNRLDVVTNNLDKLAKIVTDGFAEQAKFNKQQLEFNTRIEKEVLNLGNRLDRVIKVNNLKE